MKLKSLLLVIGAALALPAAADAAIVQIFTSHAAFTAAIPGATALPLALPGVPPVIVPSVTTGALTISAQDGMLAGDGADIISTELDSDILVLNFAQPLYAVGLYGGVVDLDFAYLDGSLSVEAVGSGTTLLTAPSATYLGLLSDIAFTQLRLSVASFDGNLSSIAFGALQTQVDRGPSVAAIPEPAAWALMLAGFGIVGAGQRARRRATVAA